MLVNSVIDVSSTTKHVFEATNTKIQGFIKMEKQVLVSELTSILQ